MSNLNLSLEECSINNIYRESREKIIYRIPIYQRNYSWGRDEISALIKDVYDSWKTNKQTYYIGTLVTYNRGDNIYEVIDGQQRLTTIFLILKALEIKDVKNTLTYSSRKISADTIRNLPSLGEEYDLGIKNGFEVAKDIVKDEIGDDDINGYTKYFLDNVHIIHYQVPKDIDLNHYFEVMNSRGEQLEKHEIIKAKLSEKLIGNDMAKFSRIWEACSEMNFYIQQKLNEESVFGSNLSSFKIDSFDKIADEGGKHSGEYSSKKKIKELIDVRISSNTEANKDDKSDQFQPIIDFPNFLLIVLKITLAENPQIDYTKFSLDDKELISEFDKVENLLDTEFVKKFAYNLLKAK